jgi:hypothetical protein
VARRLAVTSQRIEPAARADAVARADAWIAAWAHSSPAFDARALREALRGDDGVRAVHFTTRLGGPDAGAARLALDVMRPLAIPAMTLALRDPDLATAVLRALDELDARPIDALAAILDAPASVRDHVHTIAWLLLKSISRPTDVTRHVYAEGLARGDNASAVAPVPQLGDRERAWLARWLADGDAEVRAAVLAALAGYAHYLHDDPIAELVLACLDDPACMPAVLAWAHHRPDLAPVERLEPLLAAASQRGRVWHVLVARGRVEQAIAAYDTADDDTRHGLIFALSDHGGARGRAFLLGLLESEATPRALRQSIVVRFHERRETAIVRRFEHLLE